MKNRFILLLEESYDCYDPCVPHCVETEHTKEEVLSAIQAHIDRANRWFDAWPPGDASKWNPPYDSGPLLDTGMSVGLYEVACVKYDREKHRFQCVARLLGVDEWFAEFANKRFNTPIEHNP